MYPVLMKRRWLMPFCQIHRWFKLLFKGGTKHAINDLKIGSSVTEEQAKQTSDFLKNVGLKK